MAELEDAPWATKKQDAISVHPVDDGLPDAPWATPKVGYGEDMVKGGISGAAQGVIGLPGLPGDLQQLAIKAGKPLGWLADKIGDTELGKLAGKGASAVSEAAAPLGNWLRAESAKTANLPAAQTHSGDNPIDIHLPTSGDIQAKVEKATGPFYQAQTGPGKAAQTFGQVLPAIATGGEGVLPTLARSAGAGAVSEGAGEGANALKGYLPDRAAPYAEPVARAIGAGAGALVARPAVTPLPMSDNRLATVDALRATNRELVDASTAGQLTQSPAVAALEARAPRMHTLPQEQSAAYTQGVMSQAGAPGAMFDTPGLQRAQGTGAQIDALRNTHRMSPAEFALLNRNVAAERANLFRSAGTSEPFDRIQAEISGGPTGGNPQPLDMTGQRYGALKQMAQSAGEGAPTSQEQTAIFNTRRHLNEAFHNSMPADEAQRLRDLDQNYSNFKTIQDIPRTAGENTLSPQQVHVKAGVGSPLETHADQAAQVMRPLPKPNREVPPSVDLMLAALNGVGLGGAVDLLGAGHGAAAGIGTEGAVLGHLLAPSIYNGAKDIAGRVVAHPAVQPYLKNQIWRPGPYSQDPSVMTRLLMHPATPVLATPPVTQAKRSE